MMNINRFSITEKGLQKSKDYLKGKITKSKAPRFAQRFRDDLTVSKSGEVLYKNLPLIPKEKHDSFFRDVVYTRGSSVPLSRDAGFAAITKLAWGLPRRAWDAFLKKQATLRSTDRAPPEHKKAGKPAKNLFTLETDLLEVRTSQMPKTLKHIKNSYILTTVHRTTGLTDLIWIKNKNPQTATGALFKSLDWFSNILKIPVKNFVMVSDAGFEISTEMLAEVGVKHVVQKLGASVEARNGVARRQLFKVINLKRGGFEASLNQTKNIINNMKSKILKKTPMEAVLQMTEDEIIEKFNEKRQKPSANNRVKLEIGTRIRLSKRSKKDVMYKSNEGTQWGSITKIIGVTKKQPHRYRVEVTEKIRNKWITHKKWITRDKFSVLPKTDDTISAALLKNRLQSGTRKKTPKKRTPKIPAPLRKRSMREGAKKGIEKRRRSAALYKNL